MSLKNNTESQIDKVDWSSIIVGDSRPAKPALVLPAMSHLLPWKHICLTGQLLLAAGGGYCFDDCWILLCHTPGIFRKRTPKDTMCVFYVCYLCDSFLPHIFSNSKILFTWGYQMRFSNKVLHNNTLYVCHCWCQQNSTTSNRRLHIQFSDAVLIRARVRWTNRCHYGWFMMLDCAKWS